MESVNDEEIEEGDMLILDQKDVVVVEWVERDPLSERALRVGVRQGYGTDIEDVHPRRLSRFMS